MELFKTCVQNKWRLLFRFFFIINRYCRDNVILQQMCVKSDGEANDAMICIQYYTPNVIL